MLIIGSRRATPAGLVTDFVLNPYIAASAHHRPVGTGAQFAAADHPETLSWMDWKDQRNSPGGPNLNIGFPFGRPYYPINNNSPRADILRVPKPPYDGEFIDIPAYNVPVPAGGIPHMKPGHAGDDSEMCLINEETGEVWEYRGADVQPGYPAPFHRWNAGSLQKHWVIPNGNPNVGRTSGLGHGLFGGDRVGPSASGVGSRFGVVMANEMNGLEPIRHVWQIAMPRKQFHGQPPNNERKQMLSRQRVLPATSIDGRLGDNDNVGHVVYGRVYALPLSVNINSFGFTAQERLIAQSWQEYGIVPVDGAGAVAFRADQYCTATHRDRIRRVWMEVADLMRPILNSAWDPNDRLKPTGGGDPIAPNSAYDA